MTKQAPRIVLTGGGTAGHVMPHLAILPEMQRAGWQILYIGSSGIEKKLASGAGIAFYTISAGKLRRYLSLQNFFDLFKVGLGFLQSLWGLWRFKPDLVFSKGGFVGVPVALAAKLLGIPVLIHESDLTPGLANRIVSRFAAKIMYSFPESEKYLPRSKAVHTGTPIRSDLGSGDKFKARQLCGFAGEAEKKVVLVAGGSLGAAAINDVIAQNLTHLTERYQWIHLTGQGKRTVLNQPGYASFEYLGSELKDVLALADFVVCRGGANSIFEFLALKKPMLIVPLEKGSRGDQIDNAKSFAKMGWAHVLYEKDLSAASLLTALTKLEDDAAKILSSQNLGGPEQAKERVVAVMRSFFA